MASLVDLEGVGPANAKKLLKAGVRSTGSLLKKGGTRKGREEIAAISKIDKDLILQWVNHVDLYRIKGVGSEFADLLEAAGVDTVMELAKRDPKKLVASLAKASAKGNLTNRVPTEKMAKSWVSQAKKLARAVFY